MREVARYATITAVELKLPQEVEQVRYQELVDAGLEKIRAVEMEPYLDLGAETRSQNRLNRLYTDSLTFEMRILGSEPAELQTELFGSKLNSPIIASPLCNSRVLEKLGPWETHYLEQIAGGLADAGSMMTTGNLSLSRLGSIVDQGAPTMHIVHPYKDGERVLEHLEQAQRLGCVAVGMNVDGMHGCKAGDEVPGPDYLGPQSLEKLKQFVDATPLPFVIKGVLSTQDAVRARDLGAKGIIVSQYGGEAIDYAVPLLQLVADIRAAVPELTVLADSGFRRGTDVLKALALGADGVGIVTLLLIAVAANGRDGVRTIVELLNEELQRTMSYVGFNTVSETEPSALHRMSEALTS